MEKNVNSGRIKFEGNYKKGNAYGVHQMFEDNDYTLIYYDTREQKTYINGKLRLSGKRNDNYKIPSRTRTKKGIV